MRYDIDMKGIKIGEKRMEAINEREAILAAYRELAACGYVIGTWGNISIRYKESFVLTPSRVDSSVMQAEDLVLVGMDGLKICGERNPSSEKEVHRQIYVKRPDIGAIIHCHSTYATAVSAAGVDIPPIVEEVSQLVGNGICCTKEYVRAGEHERLGEQAAAFLYDNLAVLLKNHGPVCCGSDITEALLCCRVVEKAAQMFLALEQGLHAKCIPIDAVRLEHDRYKYTYGKET